MTAHGFIFGKVIKVEKCNVLYPSRWKDFVCGEKQAFLPGEAAGFISASSLEGTSYVLDSAEILSRILNLNAKEPEKRYWRRTFKLRLKRYKKLANPECSIHRYCARSRLKAVSQP